MERVGWFVLVLATWGAANFLMKVVGVRIDAYSAVVGIVVGYAIVGLTFGFGGGGRFVLSWSHMGAMIIGACYIVGNWAYIKLAATEDVSAIAPLGGLNIVIPIVLGFLLLGEPITLRKLLGIAFASVLLLSGRS